MKQENKTIRLIYPQWQGGLVNYLLPELSPDEASRGYYLGAHLLDFLAPRSNQEKIEVPISLDVNDRNTERGINSRSAIIKQTKAALGILSDSQPDRIITLGGECSVSVVPFTYLAKKYVDDLAVIWIDAHPDLNLPGDTYEGYHAMALSAVIGLGDSEIMSILPAKVKSSNALLVGLRSWEPQAKPRQMELGIKGLSPEEVKLDSDKILDWLKSTGASKVVIHFDLDVLDPEELIAAAGTEPNGMKIDEVLRVIKDVSKTYDIVGLTIAEHVPRVAIKLKSMLEQLPLFN